LSIASLEIQFFLYEEVFALFLDFENSTRDFRVCFGSLLVGEARHIFRGIIKQNSPLGIERVCYFTKMHSQGCIYLDLF
jgi:hypothetical protein